MENTSYDEYKYQEVSFDEYKYQEVKCFLDRDRNIQSKETLLIIGYPEKFINSIWPRLIQECNWLEGKKYDDFSGKLKESTNDLRDDILQLIIIRQEDKASEIVAKNIIDNNSIYSIKQDSKSEIWFYEDGIYKPNGESQIKEICRNILEEAYTPQRVNKIIAKIEADTFIEAETFFKSEQKNIFEIPVENGILNIKDTTIIPFTPEKIFFNKINAKYIPGTTCPSISKFFGEVLETEDDIKVAFEFLGACLYKKYFPQQAIMLLGDGENGKSVFIGLIKNFLGFDNCSSIALNQMGTDSFSICGLFGKLANLAGDISNTDLKDDANFKSASSGIDLLNVKRKFKEDLKFVNYAKMIFSCNELPKVYDLTPGFWRRWLILLFKYRFLKENEYNKLENKTNVKLADPNILDKLIIPEEMSGLLNEALNGLNRLWKNKGYSYTKSTSQVKDFWIRKSDPFTAFCYDFLEEDIDSFVSKKELRKLFNNYCKKYKVKGTSDRNIKTVLEDLFGVIESKKIIDKETYEREMVWEGIKIKEKLNIVQGVDRF